MWTTLLIHNELSGDGEFSASIPVFDTLTYPQKMAVLHQVTHALFRPDVPMPELTAVLEGAVAAVIQNAYWLVEEEVVTTQDSHSFRSLIAEACRELDAEEELELPDETSDDLDEWAFCGDCLHGAILWDSDYLEDDNVTDLAPEHGELVKNALGINASYFQAVAYDPLPKTMKVLAAELKALCTEVALVGHPKPPP